MVVDPEYHYQNFEPPPMAPVFEPNDEEFKDPLSYIDKIRPIAQKYGTVKIKPPASWQPPFALDIDKFKFTPRIQRLNECEAISRVRMAFLNKIANFWTLQGSILKVPLVENKYVDLCRLHKEVKSAGGYDVCMDQKRWSGISKKMGFKAMSGSNLKLHYDKILLPFDIYESGLALEHATKGKEATETTTSKPPFGRRTAAGGRYKKAKGEPESCETDEAVVPQTPPNRNTPRELRKLQFQGLAGPKAAVIQEERPKQSPTKNDDPVIKIF